MKKEFIRLMMAIVAVLTVSGCSAQSEKKDSNKLSVNDDHVEVIYFYSKKRCVTCVAIETLTQEVLEKEFADEMKNGKVVFKKIDISTEEGEKLAYEYEVAWSSLFINKIKGKKEKVNNMTEFAFSNAYSSPEVFKKGIIEKIEQLK